MNVAVDENEQMLAGVIKHLKNLYPGFSREIAASKFEFRTDLPTACTDGKGIYINPNFFKKITDREKTAVLAHEIMHIKFDHLRRMKDREGNMRDSKLWNIATDAIINENLANDMLFLPEGCVRLPNATKYTAEQLYNALKKLQDKKQQNQKNNSQGNNSQDKSNGDGNSDDFDFDVNNHNMWEKVFEEAEEQKQEQDKKQSKQDTDESEPTSCNTPDNSPDYDIDENAEFKKNRELRRKIQKQEQQAPPQQYNEEDTTQSFGPVGTIEEDVLDWTSILKEGFNSNSHKKKEKRFSQRHSPNGEWRKEKNKVKSPKVTEVMVDISGSVSKSMVKNFLRTLKQILPKSELKVGFFNDTATKEFIEIHSEDDIDNLKFNTGGGTSGNAALGAFTDDPSINKVVFTDGEIYDTLSKDYENIEHLSWVVYDKYSNFQPNCGEVLLVDPDQFTNEETLSM